MSKWIIPGNLKNGKRENSKKRKTTVSTATTKQNAINSQKTALPLGIQQGRAKKRELTCSLWGTSQHWGLDHEDYRTGNRKLVGLN